MMYTDIIPADEARKKRASCRAEIFNNAIYEALIERGASQTCIPFTATLQEVEELETLGYKVKATNNNTFIYWK